MSVYSTSALRVGVFRCPPGDALWHETNDNIGERPHVVFPATAVGLVRGGTHLTATPNDVVFYRPFETYERSLRDARGDVCLFIAPRDLDVPAAPLGRADARSFLLARRLASRLDDALFVEETAAELIAARDRRACAPTPAAAPTTRRDRAELTEAAKDLLLEHLTEPLSLAALAAELHVSPFHLTRVFRERTGRTLTEYLHDLRLRAAVERLGEESLSRIAADLGYCSASHFTDRFRASLRRPALATAQSHGSGDARRVVEPPHDQARFGPRGPAGTRGPRDRGRRLQGTGEGPLAAHGSGGQVLRVGRRAARRPRPRRRGRGARRRAGSDAVGRPGLGVGAVRPHRAGHPPLRGEDGRPERLLDHRRRRRRPRRQARHPQRRAAPDQRHRGPRLPLLRSHRAGCCTRSRARSAATASAPR